MVAPIRTTQNPPASVPPRVGRAEPASVSRPGSEADGRATRSGAARPALPRELLERVRSRDPDALAEFFERYFDQVYGLVRHLLGDRTAAEDITQEVFLKVHRAASQLDPSRDPAPWLWAIAANACRDVWRSGAYRMGRRSASIEQDEAVALRLASRGDDPERAAIAAELGLNHAAVRKRYSRALAALGCVTRS